MNSLNRKIAPDFRNIGKTEIFQPRAIKFKNEIPLFVFNLQEADLLKMEMIFQIPYWNPIHPLSISSASKLMDDGSSKKNSAQIAEEIDFYGSYYQVQVQADLISIELYSLRKHLAKTLPVLFEILTDAIFPEAEIGLYKINNIQRIRVEDLKVQKLGSKLFYHSLFGSDFQYGYMENEKDYENLKREDILNSYSDIFRSSNCTILVSGKVEESDIATIEYNFGNSIWGKNPTGIGVLNDFNNFQPLKPEYIFRPIADTSQSAIKIGKTMVLKNHPDFPYLQVLNTVLGGYFGSRLMSNIREDKGYTYGIGSSISGLKKAGLFYITTEVKAESTQDCIREIHLEINRLKSEPIKREELELVKNFIRGSFLSSLENAFSYADKFKSIYFQGLDYDYYDRLFDAIEESSPIKLMEMANLYFSAESFHTIIVGKE